MFQKYSRKPQSKIHWHVSCVLLLTIVLSFVAGCSDKKNDSQTELDNTLYLGTYQKPEPFIYPMITGGISQPLMDILFNRLFLLTTDGQLHPELAEKWEILEHGKKFIIHLRRGVKFHDGVELTSRDVHFTLNWLRNPDLSNRAGNYSEIETISTPNDSTVEITLKKSNVNFLWIAASVAHIYPAHLFSGIPTQDQIEKFGKHPVGTGPYQFYEWKEDNTIVLFANQGYFDGVAHIQRIVVRPYSSKLHLFNAFVRGDVDFLIRLDSDDYETIRKDMTFQTVKDTTGSTYALMFNFKSPITGDANFRRAVSIGLRRNEMIELLEKGNGEPVQHVNVYEPEKALELLKTVKESFSMKLIVEGSSTQQMKLAKIIRNQLAEIGINVQIKPVNGLDSAVRLLRESSAWDAILFNFQTVVDRYHLEHYLRSRSVANIGNYENSKLDSIFKKLEIQENIVERKKLFEQLNNMLNQDVPVCLLYVPYNFIIASEKIKGISEKYLSNINVTYFSAFKDLKRNNERG